ncbi:hypothetical protein ABZ896_48180 [Streptomyces sp. NPDC047072]|uniref:hypothetical protein n=1 Tax=Streptomyces sp. NPDC047072 TaxID=3154809 RepID=UPI0033F1DAE3
MKRSSRARIGATATVSVLSLALITGCGGGSDEDSEDTKESTGASASTGTATKALSAAELKKKLLTPSDVPGYETSGTADTLPKAKSEVKSAKTECAPIAYAMAGLPPGDTDATASTLLTKSDTSASPSPGADITFNIEMTVVGLSSYEGDGAAKTLKAVSDAVAACGSGFGATLEGESQKITKVTAGKSAAKGDESVAFTVDADAEGEKATFNVEVVRVGATVATFYTVDFAALGSGKAAAVPTALLDAQTAKLK